MTDHKFDQALNKLYQARKRKLDVPPTIVEENPSPKENVKAKNWLKPLTLLLGGSVVSAATFAVMMKLVKQPDVPKTPVLSASVAIVEITPAVEAPVTEELLEIPELPDQPTVVNRPTSENVSSDDIESNITTPENVNLALNINFNPPRFSRPSHDYQPTLKVLPTIKKQTFKKGEIKLRFDIDGDGQVMNVETVSNSTNATMLRETKKALRQWRYETSNSRVTGMEILFEFNHN